VAKAGPYELIEELGRGSMGIVYKAFDPGIRRQLAIKILRAEQFASEAEMSEASQRFAREAMAVGRLSHHGIVTVYELGRDEAQGFQYLAMELVAGGSLEKLMRAGQPWPSEAALGVVRQIAEALDYAHAHGVVHRDIKPANVLVQPDWRIKVADFGIARITSHLMTRTGMRMGTTAYMAPEQIQGAHVDSKADQFSLAVLAYQLLAGRLPFDGETDYVLMNQIVHAMPGSLLESSAHLPAAADGVIRRALAKSPGERFEKCAEFASALDAALTVRRAPIPVVPPPPVVPTVLEPPLRAATILEAAPRRRPEAVVKSKTSRLVWVGVAGLVAAALIAGIVIAPRFVPSGGQPAQTNPAVKTDTPATKAGAPTARPAADIPPAAPAAKTDTPARVEEKPVPTAAKTETPKTPEPTPADKTKVNLKDGLTYVWIPPGSFTMGCSPGDSECYGDEKPARQVSISEGFWLGQTQVTQAAYQRVTGTNPSHFKGANLPVETVNWNEATSYCQAVGTRLPTEAEWEYAARAGSTASRYGDIDRIAWYSANSGSTTHEVMQKQPNRWGLYDMLGNVWQWTSSNYDSDSKALRGGSWYNNPRNVRVSYRYRYVPGNRSNNIGFRCLGN